MWFSSGVSRGTLANKITVAHFYVPKYLLHVYTEFNQVVDDLSKRVVQDSFGKL